MQRWTIRLVTVVLTLLSLAALDDITTGHEPHFYAEYAMITATVLWYASLAALRLRSRAS